MRRAVVPVVVATVLLAGCAGVFGGEDPASQAAGSGAQAFTGEPSGALEVMGFGGEDEVGQARVAAFEAAHPEVEVRSAKGSFDAQQFLTALAAGNPPDVVYLDRKLMGTYAAKGAVQPLGDCVAGQDIDLTQYRPAALESVTWKDRTFGIPEFMIVTTNLVDARSLGEAGVPVEDIQTRDWDALLATAEQLYSAQGSSIRRIGYDPKLPDSFPLWALANGVDLIDEAGAPHLDDPKAVEALQFALDLVEAQGGWNSFKAFRDSFDIFGEQNPLTRGTITAFPMENWYVNVLRDSIPAGLDLEATPFTDRSGEPVSTLGGQAWAIPAGAANPRAACAWARTMTATDTWMQAAAARMKAVSADQSFFTGLFTANVEADRRIRESHLRAAPDPGFQRAIDDFYDALDRAEGLHPSPAAAEIDAAWRSGVSRALEGASAEEALGRAQDEATKAYDAVAK